MKAVKYMEKTVSKYNVKAMLVLPQWKNSPAVNKALNHGAKLKNLVMKTIHTTKSNFGENKAACANCTATFKGVAA